MSIYRRDRILVNDYDDDDISDVLFSEEKSRQMSISDSILYTIY